MMKAFRMEVADDEYYKQNSEVGSANLRIKLSISNWFLDTVMDKTERQVQIVLSKGKQSILV
jgi:hypothetical protein